MNNPIQVIFVGNGSNSNRGCEAIVRGTAEILKRTFGNIECLNIFNTINSNDSYRSDLEDTIDHKALNIGHKNYADRAIKAASLRYAPRIWEALSIGWILPDIRNCDLVLSIGGDNYSLDYGLPRRFIQLGKMVKRQRKPFVIFGGSVGPFDGAGTYEKTVLHHLREEVDQIHVREERSYNYLNKIGCRNVFRTADPAFLMSPKKPMGFEIDETNLSSAIGLNLSPLIMKRIDTKGVDSVKWIKQLVMNLIDKEQRPIVLVYHVTSPHTNDYELLQAVQHALHSDRLPVYLLKLGMSAPELKWVISKLSCLIGSRTHATIASLSSCVPTVSIAYSVKALGINEALFRHTDYVVPVEQASIERLSQTTSKAIRERTQIKAILSDSMQAVKAKALEAGYHLKSLLS